MIILDTNVISELTRAKPDESVLAWADAISGPEAGTTSVTVAELLYGIARLPAGARKADLSNAVHQLLTVDFNRHILSFDVEAAAHYAAIVADRDETGRPIDVADAQIAGICRSVDAVLATRNIKDFDGTGVKLMNPWAKRGAVTAS